MANIRKTAMGNSIDIDRLRLANESTITIGNTKTNARGDLLGAGGAVVKTKAQIQQEYYALNTPLADDAAIAMDPVQADPVPLAQPTAEDDSDPTPPVDTGYVKPRGSFAEAVASGTEVKQELLEPLKKTQQTQGIQRI